MNVFTSIVSDKQTMLELQARNEEALRAYFRRGDDGTRGATIDNMDPSRPFLYLEVFDPQKVNEV